MCIRDSPGVVSDQQDALDRLSQTAELVFRPVVFDQVASGAPFDGGLGAAVPSHNDDDVVEDGDDDVDGDDGSDETDVEDTEPAVDEADEVEPGVDIDDADDEEIADDEAQDVDEDDEPTEGDAELSLGAAPTDVAFRFQNGEDELNLDDLDLDGLDLDLDNLDLEGLDAEDLLLGDVLVGAPSQCPTELTQSDGVEDSEFITLFDTLGPVCLGPVLFKGCLLYTSPSPRDRQKSRMPSSA